MKTKKEMSQREKDTKTNLSSIEMKKINGGANSKPATGGGGTGETIFE